jgi:O-antigen/teichoic acid export membrane protein
MLKKVMTAIRNPASLGERALNASLWQVASVGVQYPLRLASNLILTRLLLPEAFGMIAIITVLQVGLYLFTDIGLMQSVMRDKRGAEPQYLRVAWVVQVIRGIAITLLMVAVGFLIMWLGPKLAAPNTIYADPVLPWLIVFSSLSLLCKGLESTNVLLAMREMRQKQVVGIDIAAQLLGIAIMVPLAWYTESVWALAIGSVASSVLRLILTHTIFPGPRMAVVWDREQSSEMWTYGRWLIASSAGGFMLNFGDRLILSALMDKHYFGIYSIALVWIEMARNLIQKIAGSTLVPAISQAIRETPEKVRRVLSRFTGAFEVVTLGIIIGIFATADLIFGYLYRDTYAPAADLARLNAFKLLISMSLPARHFVMAAGNSFHYGMAHILGAICSVTACYFGYVHFGLEAAILFSALGALMMPMVIIFERGLADQMKIPLEVGKIALAIAVTIAALVYVFYAPGVFEGSVPPASVQTSAAQPSG